MKLTALVSAILLSTSAFAAIDGEWSTECFQPQDATVQASAKYTQTFAKGTFSMDSYSYSDRDCKVVVMVESYKGSYAERTTATGTNELDLIYNQQFMQINDQATLDFLNQIEYCDYTDWTAGAAKEVTSKTCYFPVEQGGKIVAQPVEYLVPGAQEFTIYKVDTAGLFMGAFDDQHDGFSAATRPVALTADAIMTLVK